MKLYAPPDITTERPPFDPTKNWLTMAETYVTYCGVGRMTASDAMSSSIASAVTISQDENDHPVEAKGMKRRLSASLDGDKEMEQENKRQRISPGKISPKIARDGDAPSNPPATNAGSPEQPADPREARRKSSIADEKQRSKRLFGALLGSLNQPSDRTSKRRQEIESRRKAELQRQDDERLEDKQRRQERLAEQRKKAQMKVEEENVSVVDEICRSERWADGFGLDAYSTQQHAQQGEISSDRV
jgi:hypothetical protein